MLRSYLFFLFVICCIVSCKTNPSSIEVKSDNDYRIKSELDKALLEDILNRWYPLVIDTLYGGYLSDFNHQWIKEGKQNKFIVTQARHLWTLSKAIELFPENKMYRYAAKHGFEYLRDVMWDSENGGFINLVEQDGTLISDPVNAKIMKHAYGNSFAIYGLSAYFKTTKNQEALDLAKKGFLWLEEHSHDSEFGGYFQFMNRNGNAINQNFGSTPPKDQNSSIHLMEAFTELYSIWKDDLLKTRLNEIMVLIRDDMTDDRGFLNLYFQKDWTPHSYRDSSVQVREANYNLDHVSFGHDIETAWLLLEACTALDIHHDKKTLVIAKKMVDHGLDYGYDASTGGVYDRGYYFKNEPSITIIKDGKNWWSQVETLNTLLYLTKIYPDDKMDYKGKFEQQWNYIKTYLIDQENGGFYAGGIDKEPKQKLSVKSQIWKSPYHTFRALMNCSQMLDPG